MINIPRPPIFKPKYLPKYWWEEFLKWEPTGAPHHSMNRLSLSNIETNEYIGGCNNFQQLNEMAEKYLNNLFEKIVIFNE